MMCVGPKRPDLTPFSALPPLLFNFSCLLFKKVRDMGYVGVLISQAHVNVRVSLQVDLWTLVLDTEQAGDYSSWRTFRQVW